MLAPYLKYCILYPAEVKRIPEVISSWFIHHVSPDPFHGFIFVCLHSSSSPTSRPPCFPQLSYYYSFLEHFLAFSFSFSSCTLMTSFLNPSMGFPCITAHYQRPNGRISHCTATKGSLIFSCSSSSWYSRFLLALSWLPSCSSAAAQPRSPTQASSASLPMAIAMVASYFLSLTAWMPISLMHRYYGRLHAYCLLTAGTSIGSHQHSPKANVDDRFFLAHC